MTTFTFSRGPDASEGTLLAVPQPRQIVTRSEAGQVRVATVGPEEELYQLVFTLLPQADVDALIAFLSDPLIYWAANTFTYTDVVSVARTVRAIANSFTRNGGAPLCTVRLTLRKEVA